MLSWREEGLLLAVRKHGENAVIAEVLTRDHGRHAGVIRGGQGRKLAPVLQPGAQLDLTWSARLEDHLGAFVVEPVRSRAGLILSDRLALAGLAATLSLTGFVLPEREPHPAFYDRTVQLLDLMGTTDAWPLAYLGWEAALLDEMGFGLDLGTCAVTGGTDDLIYVSPKSGRAVSRAGAGAWADRLLPLPPALRGEGPAPDDEILAGLRTTGHFLETRLAPALGEKPLPVARERLLDALARHSA